MQQVFMKELAKVGQPIPLDEQQAHHFAVVLRMKNDEVIRVVDGEGKIYLAKIKFINNQIQAICFEQLEVSAERVHSVTLLMGLIKKEKWDFCLQKSTELGVTRIIPFESARTIVKAKEEKSDKKLERWQKIMQEAAQQCKRDLVPEIVAPISLKEADQYKSDINFVAYESSALNGKKLRDCLQLTGSVTIVIGPEGGFDESEINYLNQYGYECITLGKRILRAETAALYALSAIDALIE